MGTDSDCRSLVDAEGGHAGRVPLPVRGRAGARPSQVGFCLGAFRSEIPRTLAAGCWSGPTGACHDSLTVLEVG